MSPEQCQPHDPSLGEQFTGTLIRLNREMVQAFEQSIGMSQSRMQLLFELLRADEMSQIALAQRLGIEGPAITRLVKHMEAEGLITRHTDPKDNRFTLVALAPAGRQIILAAMRLKASFDAQIMEGLNEVEQVQTVQAMKRIHENIRRWRTLVPVAEKTLSNP
jgi:MarR family transcriptional regulator, transcriptional regulator for hemolysin